MIVELIGSPGCGKTSLLPSLEKKLGEQGYKAFTVVEASRPVVSRTLIGKSINTFLPAAYRDRLLWQVFYFGSFLSRRNFSKLHPNLITHVRKTQSSREIPLEEREHALYWWFHLSGYYQFLKPRLYTNEVLILDEGFSHRVVQLFASDSGNPNRGDLQQYLALIPRPDMLIFVNAPAAICEQRVHERGLWARMQHKSPQQISQFISNAHSVVDAAVKELKLKEWVVIEIDNSAAGLAPAEEELNRKLSHYQINSMQPDFLGV